MEARLAPSADARPAHGGLDLFPPVRLDLPLEAGHCVTVEPGVYLIPALLQDGERRRRHAGAGDWGRVDRMLDFGGIRIEHDVLVTDAGREVLTAGIPIRGGG